MGEERRRFNWTQSETFNLQGNLRRQTLAAVFVKTLPENGTTVDFIRMSPLCLRCTTTMENHVAEPRCRTTLHHRHGSPTCS
ncbi:hypothetical protein EYF80_054376 [Liparis tanakae]|uniref:Uncharacterized protein n=1 Tax=Liparis tanakae TaxID=230148 RepID=A0A4Z2F2S9_9TELE|nr:hypothetical protein EYF80_054376 [Liparis tanakae]